MIFWGPIRNKAIKNMKNPKEEIQSYQESIMCAIEFCLLLVAYLHGIYKNIYSF